MPATAWKRTSNAHHRHHGKKRQKGTFSILGSAVVLIWDFLTQNLISLTSSEDATPTKFEQMT